MSKSIEDSLISETVSGKALDRALEIAERLSSHTPESGRPGEALAYAGTDFNITRDSRIAPVYLFFDELQERES